MPSAKNQWLGLVAAQICCCVLLSVAHAAEVPRTTLQAAIKAHGGNEKIAKTLTGTLIARVKTSLPPNVEAAVSWEETFQLPRRYHRRIKGQLMDKDFSMEYSISEGNGWIRRDGGAAKDFKGEKLSLGRSWNAVLALLPLCLGDGVELRSAGTEMINEREAVGVSVSGKAIGGEAIFFFDTKTGLLAKSKKRIQHFQTREEVDGEIVFSDYKEVSGVQYPHRLATYAQGKRLIDMEITRIEFLKELDDRLFEKP